MFFIHILFDIVIINEIKAQKDLNSNKSRPGNKVWLVCDDNILDKLFMDQKNNIRSGKKPICPFWGPK